ncbi:hypothetical protein [Aquimarina sp. 2201CG5-10]|uniref:hypothetical protein n=1 Tax=Aquimarina callyspongiae TaxID=3098150 RepID=UPI002AB5C371|nr:hypothetical protein [Aquimarina sp. 2201CG5-10]MDY8135407.1 hypothetical protein [Aquimarina sp. 2201CG5-10]
MKKTFVIFIMLFTSIKVIACSCQWSGNFLRIANNSELIIKGKIIEHNYHTENGKRFTDYDEYFAETLNNEFDPFYGTGESIKVEIIEVLRGKEERKVIEIFDTDGADCRASIRKFKTGKIYIFAMYKPRRTGTKLPNETENDYAITSCFESTLEYFPKENKVFGMIKGKSYKRKSRKYSYEKLKRKIT